MGIRGPRSGLRSVESTLPPKRSFFLPLGVFLVMDSPCRLAPAGLSETAGWPSAARPSPSCLPSGVLSSIGKIFKEEGLLGFFVYVSLLVYSL